MTELYPPPEPPKPAPKEKDKDKDKEAGGTASDFPTWAKPSNKIAKLVSNFGGGKGTVFLVSVKSREVLWSTYAKPKDTRGEQMDKTAGKICTDLKKSMAGKQS